MKTKHSSSNAEFCYSLWLSILVLYKENNIQPPLHSIGEIGTGGSLGIGLCALLTGTNKYYALELECAFNKDNNLKLLNELVILFRNKSPVSSNINILNIKINDYAFPDQLIAPRFDDNKFISKLKDELNNNCINSDHITIVYNWEKANPLNLDMIFSRAVMEHVRKPEDIYKGICNHLKSNSYMLHDIELHSHGLTKKINGHFNIHPLIWNIIYGRRLYYLNRWNIDDHLNATKELDFKLITVQESFYHDLNSDNKVLTGALILAKTNQNSRFVTEYIEI